MKHRHTPKPWKIVKDGQGHIMIAGGRSPDPATRARHLFVAEVARAPIEPVVNPTWEWLTEEEVNANAKLISQAPKMFDALTRIANTEIRSDRRHRGMTDISEVESLIRHARITINEVNHA